MVLLVVFMMGIWFHSTWTWVLSCEEGALSSVPVIRKGDFQWYWKATNSVLAAGKIIQCTDQSMGVIAAVHH